MSAHLANPDPKTIAVLQLTTSGYSFNNQSFDS
jgi:hypothetical protein